MNGRFEAALTAGSSYSAEKFPPEAASFYMAYYGRGAVGKIVAGDFNIRFGQGLAMWSGFSMSGTPAPGSFSRRASGISPYWSYSGEGSHRGVAADFSAGKFMISAFVSVPGLKGQFCQRQGCRNLGASGIQCLIVRHGRTGFSDMFCQEQDACREGIGRETGAGVRTGTFHRGVQDVSRCQICSTGRGAVLRSCN